MDADLPRIVTASVPGPASLALGSRLSAVESPDTTYLSSDFPVFWESASGCIVRDVDGNSYFDATSSFGALSVGHGHPAVREAIIRQAETMIHGMGDVHPSRVKVELLERICRYAPLAEPKAILGLSGSDAVEAALKTSLLATGKRGVLAFHGGYHGLSFGALEPTARPGFREPFEAQRGRFTDHVPFGCPIAEIAERIARADSPIGAVIVEPIQGRGGVRVPPEGWLAELKGLCSARGILMIADEIYTGWGRTGDLFACSHEPVVPDLLCIGKAMGGGMPISACVGSAPLIERAWPKSRGEAIHTSTFLGHPLACAAACAAIDVIAGERLADRARDAGDRLIAELVRISANSQGAVAEVRGRGLMIGVRMSTAQIARRCLLECLRRGLIVLSAGDDGATIELTPPLVATDKQLAWCAETLAAAIDSAGT